MQPASSAFSSANSISGWVFESSPAIRAAIIAALVHSPSEVACALQAGDFYALITLTALTARAVFCFICCTLPISLRRIMQQKRTLSGNWRMQGETERFYDIFLFVILGDTFEIIFVMRNIKNQKNSWRSSPISLELTEKFNHGDVSGKVEKWALSTESASGGLAQPLLEGISRRI